MTTRRTFLAHAAAAGVALSGGFPALIRTARAAEPLTFITPFGFDPAFIEMMNAVAGGHFARQGLDAKLLGGTGTAQALQMVVADQAQFSLCSGLDLIHAIGGKGAPLLGVATINQGTGFNIASLKDKPIRTADDFRGKTVGILAVGGTSDTVLQLTLAKLGLTRNDVHVVAVGNNPGEVELIKQGRIDCFVCTYSVTVTLQRMNAPVEFISFDKLVLNPGQAYWTRRDIVAQKPEFARKVLRGLHSSIEEIVNNPLVPIYERAAKLYDIPGISNMDNVVAVQTRMIKELWLGEGRDNLMHNVKRRWLSGIDALHKLGMIESTDPKKYYTDDIVDHLDS